MRLPRLFKTPPTTGYEGGRAFTMAMIGGRHYVSTVGPCRGRAGESSSRPGLIDRWSWIPRRTFVFTDAGPRPTRGDRVMACDGAAAGGRSRGRTEKSPYDWVGDRPREPHSGRILETSRCYRVPAAETGMVRRVLVTHDGEDRRPPEHADARRDQRASRVDDGHAFWNLDQRSRRPNRDAVTEWLDDNDPGIHARRVAKSRRQNSAS